MNFPAFKRIYSDIGLVLISAILLILSFSPVKILEFLAWFAFVPLFFSLENKSKGKAFLISYFWGIIFWAGTIYWLSNVTFAGLILLVLYLGLYLGIFGMIVSFSLSHFRALTRLLFVPCVWVLLEYLRSCLFSGFPWGLLGYSQYLNLPIIQIAGVTGVWGISFSVMILNTLIYLMFDSRCPGFVKKKKSILPITSYALVLVLFSLSLGYGFYKLQRAAGSEQQATIKISVIQGNIPQAIKWQAIAREKILQEYRRLSSLAALDNPDLKDFVGKIGIPLVVGAANLENGDYYNSAILVSREGEFIQRYDKLHLVPFGEYIPLRKIFTFLETVVPIGDFRAGQEYRVFSLEATEEATKEVKGFSVLICFEDIFSSLSRRFVKQGADFLINITNDAWFGDTLSPYQHLSASVLRAVENGVYLVRAANTGVSGFITPEGRIYPLIDRATGRQTFISGYLTEEINLSSRASSLYTQWGDWFILLCFFTVIYLAWLARKRGRG